MKKVLLVVAVALPLALLAAGWQASAQDGDDNQMLPPDNDSFQPNMIDDTPLLPQGGKMQEFMEKLGITEEQMAALQEARVEHMKEMIEIGARLRVAQIELRELIGDYGNDQAVLAKNNEINGIRTQIADLRLRHQLAQRALFTAEQWDKVSKAFSMMKHRRTGAGRGFGDRGTHPGFGGPRGGKGMPQRNFSGPRGGMQPRNQ